MQAVLPPGRDRLPAVDRRGQWPLPLRLLRDQRRRGLWSVEALTHEQWLPAASCEPAPLRFRWHGVAMVLHLMREFSFGHYRGPRWFSWVTGMAILRLVVGHRHQRLQAGVGPAGPVRRRGDDRVARHDADLRPVDGTQLHFAESVNDRFFSLLTFLHIGLPLFLLLILWIHIQRVGRRTDPSGARLAVGTFLTCSPVGGQAGVEPGAGRPRARAPLVGLDWFYLRLLPAARELAGAGELGGCSER